MRLKFFALFFTLCRKSEESEGKLTKEPNKDSIFLILDLLCNGKAWSFCTVIHISRAGFRNSDTRKTAIFACRSRHAYVVFIPPIRERLMSS